MINRYKYSLPIGFIEIVDNGSEITGIHITDNCNNDGVNSELSERAYTELNEYFEGKRKSFDLPIKAEGTEFQINVWKELTEIPYGETISYGELARRIGNPKASRAVGGANNKNPIIIVIPCHRVIGANGSLVGYGGGIEVKRYLLDLEKNFK
ncbi:MAG: methylated-DNA--[protein]-cysteine S-methyltransferase [Clostridia bacterium]|nr:methylated-DNA--[protein]-cysteine S-methyltransferase [Clostridia bacterium]